jgi:hypothetical protein
MNHILSIAMMKDIFFPSISRWADHWTSSPLGICQSSAVDHNRNGQFIGKIFRENSL